MSDDVPDEGHTEWVEAIADGEPYYLECEAGHGWLPPRRVCPDCGSRELSAEPLPESGEIVTYTVVNVPTPQFADDAPYVTAIVDFGPVSVTGQVADRDPEAVETGQVVGIDVDVTVTENEPLVVFRPR